MFLSLSSPLNPLILVPIPFSSGQLLMMPADEVASSSLRPGQGPLTVKRLYQSGSNESTEVREIAALVWDCQTLTGVVAVPGQVSSSRKRARLHGEPIVRPGAPLPISLSAFRVPDKLSPPLREDDKGERCRFVTGLGLKSSMQPKLSSPPLDTARWTLPIRARRKPVQSM